MMRYFIIPAIVLIGIVSTGLSHASYRETFEKEFMLSPWSIAKGEVSACIQCHTSENMEPRIHQHVQEWRGSWHAKNNVSAGMQKTMSHAMTATVVPLKMQVCP
jgi:hypothetical protein